MVAAIILIAYITGQLLANWMLKVEHSAVGEEFTNGHRVLTVILSLLSWLFVFFLLIKAWAISVEPYWSKSADKNKPAA
jgi:E3 ubiquitin-protein ligase DOA10